MVLRRRRPFGGQKGDKFIGPREFDFLNPPSHYHALEEKKDRTKRFGTTEHISLNRLNSIEGIMKAPCAWVGTTCKTCVCPTFSPCLVKSVRGGGGGGLERQGGGELEGREGKKKEEMAFQRLMEK